MVTRLDGPPDPDEFETEPTEDPEEDVLALKYEISSYPADYTLRVLNDQIKEKQLVIPHFQRDYVWSTNQASRLIESFLLGLPVPEVFLYKERRTERRLVVDGHQRLGTISSFYRERFEDDKIFRLRGVDPRWDGKVYGDLEEADKLRLDNSTLRSIVIQQLDPSDHSSMYLVFERLNTGGTQLNPMEIRRVQFSEIAYPFLDRLNRHPQWRELIGFKRPQKRLRDIELVLRVLAMATTRESYSKPLKGFLNDFMRTLEGMDDSRRALLKQQFEAACTIAGASLEERPFHLRGPLNVAALDSVLGVLTTDAEFETEGLGERYRNLLSDRAFLAAIERATSDEESVAGRFARASAMLLG